MAEENTDGFIKAGGGVGVGLFFSHLLGPLGLSV
jgi:hypothetical protein